MILPTTAIPEPKVSGQGVVLKKDGTVSKPEPKPKEQDNGRNSDHRSA